jgi:3D (Asp-Asp-Asp) domain-containing protein
MPNMEIMIDRSSPLSIVVDGERMETRVSAETVGAAIAEAGVALSGLDYTIPAETNPVLPGMLIQIIRVTEEIITEQDVIGYESVYQADSSLNLDTRAVLQGGQNGIIERTIRVRYENGVEISRDEIIGYGTNVVIRTLQTADGTIEYWRHLRVYATSYHPAAVGGSTTTSIGETLQKGIIGINPRIIPYRTMLYVPGYGQGMAADTGGPRTFSYWIDLGYSDHDWVSWSQWVDIYLLTPVPSTINYLLPQEERGGPVLP